MISTPMPRLFVMSVAIAILAIASPAKSDPTIRKPRGVFLVPSRVTAPTAPTAPNNRLVYHGGRVISNVKVYQVLWGPNVWSRTATELGAFYTAVTNSEYMDWLGSQYDTAGRKSVLDGQTTSNQHIGRGSFGGTITIAPNNRSTTLTNEQIAQELTQQITMGKLPQPDVDADGNVNSLYMFDFPPGMTIYLDNSQSCVTWYAYHYTTTLNGKSVPYGVHPDFSQDCARGNFTLSTSVHSHELIEAVTDMEVGIDSIAWNSDQDGGYEIGDLCNTDATIAGYTVQKMWSNHDGACMGTSAFRLPLCTGSLTAPNCRPCSIVDNGVACTGTTPFCETDHASTKVGQCVPCTTNTQCSGATPICDKSATMNADTCRACATNADCTKGVCDTANDATKGTCVECNVNADCKDATKPVCTEHACVAPTPPPGGTPDAGSHSPGTGPDGGANGGPDPNEEVPVNDSSGCACTSAPRSSGIAGFAAVALGLILALRRRR